jgi:hypothetical protein
MDPIKESRNRSRGESHCAREADHGALCSCRLLSAAAQTDGAITFTFCTRFLARRWSLRCDHGGAEVTTRIPGWQRAEPLSGVDAVLISNA